MNDGTLFLEIIKNISVIAILMYLVTQCTSFRRAINQAGYSRGDRCILIAVFGLLSAVGNFLNVPFGQEVMAHTRLVGVIVGGLFGGPVVGIGAGIIGMIPRYFISIGGKNVVLAAMAANIIIGLFSGLVCLHFGARQISMKIAFVVAFISEVLLKMVILVLTIPTYVFELEKAIAVPVVLSTCLGVLVSVYIIRDVFTEEDRTKAQAARKVIQIILATRDVFRSDGLNKESAQKIVATMFDILDVTYVAVRTDAGILAEMNRNGHIPALASKYCLHLSIDINHKTVAQILLCRPGKRRFLPYEQQWMQGIADFFSLELYQVELDQKTVLLSQAELNVLKSQIRPHFLFNMLSNIKAIIGENPEQAKELICDLSSFLRGRLQSNEEEVTLEEEMDSVDSYLRLEKARYGKRLTIQQHISKETVLQKIPFFSIQILVENAIKHGLVKKKNGGIIQITATHDDSRLHIAVSDNGIGMDSHALQALQRHLDGGPFELAGTGIGLKNIYDRLRRIHGADCHFAVHSHMGAGTTVEFDIPWTNDLCS
ncbi:MAG: histidine kinase [Megasphaera sp.]|nr:histidine kinase [Megasphaera sp.]MCH4187029.1 histidine kinase [Megasphaera sp.]MCH4217035.1 histidine kinase [Megasphaera sp.]